MHQRAGEDDEMVREVPLASSPAPPLRQAELLSDNAHIYHAARPFWKDSGAEQLNRVPLFFDDIAQAKAVRFWGREISCYDVISRRCCRHGSRPLMI